MLRESDLVRSEGNILTISVVIVALLVASGMSYVSWVSSERWDTAFEEATIQAYFLAQTGLIEKGLGYLRTREPSDLPQGSVFLPPATVPGVGSYYNTTIRRVMALGEGSVFQRTDTYDLFSTGRTEFVNHQLGNRHYGERVRVERTATMRARLRSFANYMYLTKYEATRFNEIIWFWTRDTLCGRVHSNDYIGLKWQPVFYGPISTCRERFIEHQADPYFKFPPQFNVPPVYFPETARTLRAAANPNLGSEGDGLMTRIVLRGGGIDVYRYPLGIPFNQDEAVPENSLGAPNWQAIFVHGQVEVYGVLTGSLTIGSSGNMWLIDDIRFDGADPLNGQFSEDGMNHILGLVSESNIIIRDNRINGRADGFNQAAGNPNRHSIIINAGMVALGESFTFEHQNDSWELYQGPSPDERGIIHLKGAVTQYRRGYVHRSNHDGTGYGKDYHYDFRFDHRPPPFYLEALDEQGHGLFDIVSWGEMKPEV